MSERATGGSPTPWKPSPSELAAAVGRTIPDVLAPDLQVVFCGINPGLYSGAVGHHFARPGNRFWPALHGAGFTERILSPLDDQELLDLRIGLTNLVPRTTATAGELSPGELAEGGRQLQEKVDLFRPRALAFLGVTAYRIAFATPSAVVGPQVPLGDALVWLLPNPSGLNAHYQLPQLVDAFRELRAALP